MARGSAEAEKSDLVLAAFAALPSLSLPFLPPPPPLPPLTPLSNPSPNPGSRSALVPIRNTGFFPTSALSDLPDSSEPGTSRQSTTSATSDAEPSSPSSSARSCSGVASRLRGAAAAAVEETSKRSTSSSTPSRSSSSTEEEPAARAGREESPLSIHGSATPAVSLPWLSPRHRAQSSMPRCLRGALARAASGSTYPRRVGSRVCTGAPQP